MNDSGNRSKNSTSTDSKVVDFAAFRRRKFVENDLARGRKPLYVSHTEGKITGSPHFKGPAQDSGDDLGERIQRIRTSLQKINRLMSELKRMSAVEEPARV